MAAVWTFCSNLPGSAKDVPKVLAARPVLCKSVHPNLPMTYLLRGEAGLEQPRRCLEAVCLHGLGTIFLHSLEGLLETLELVVAAGVEGHALLLLIKRFPAQLEDCDAELTCATIYAFYKDHIEYKAHMAHKLMKID